MNQYVKPPNPIAGLYYPTPVTPEEAFRAIGRLRRAARDEIDRLLAFLDKTDPYMFFELEDAVDDGAVDEDELDGASSGGGNEDDEPSLCGITVQAGNPDDLEDDQDSGIGDRDGLCEQFSGHGLYAGGVL
jgi:hypothetical protein